MMIHDKSNLARGSGYALNHSVRPETAFPAKRLAEAKPKAEVDNWKCRYLGLDQT